MTLTIERIAGSSPKRGLGSAFGDTVFAVATADDRSADLAGQAAACFAKIDASLEALGTERANLLSVTVYLADLGSKAMFDAAWIDWISNDPAHWPQRSCIGVTLAPGTLVEIVAVAARQG